MLLQEEMHRAVDPSRRQMPIPRTWKQGPEHLNPETRAALGSLALMLCQNLQMLLLNRPMIPGHMVQHTQMLD